MRQRRARRLSVAIGLSYATLGPAEGRRARANRRAGCRELGVLGTMAERNLFLSLVPPSPLASTEPCDLLWQDHDLNERP